MKEVLIELTKKEKELIYPYVEEFKKGDINFKYWIVDERSRFLYKPNELISSEKLDGYKFIINKGDKILNVGSGYGISNCIIRNLIGDKGLLVGVDPISSNCLVSNSHFGLNNYSNCFIKNFAASYSKEKCIVWNKSNSSVNFVHTSIQGETIEVDSILCDELIPEFGNFDTLVVDVNGYELLVLTGSYEFLIQKVNIIIKLDHYILSCFNTTYENIFEMIKVQDYEGMMLVKGKNELEVFDAEFLISTKENATIFIKPKSTGTNSEVEKNKKVNLIKNLEISLQKVANNGIAPESILKTGPNFNETERLWLKYFLNKPFANKCRKGNIAMFHLGRCGSSVLGYLLDQHPQIDWGSEVFHYIYNDDIPEKRMTSKPLDILRIKMSWSHKDYYGFETKFTEHEHLRKELVNMDVINYLSTLSDLGFKKFILLKRKNYLKQIISLIAAKQTLEFHTKTEKEKAVAIKIDPQKVWFGNKSFNLIELFENFDNAYEELESLLKQKDALFLNYENDILEDPLVAYKKVCDYLGIKDNNPTVIHKRTNPFELRDLIENYDEIYNILQPTKYSWMLND